MVDELTSRGESPELIALLTPTLEMTREQWDRIQAEEGPPIGTSVETLEAWEYVVQLPQSNPYELGSADGEQFDAMRLAIRDVRARFSIERGGPDPAAAREAGDL